MSDEPKVLVWHLMEGPGRLIWLWCPGCVELHQVQIADEDGGVRAGPVWTWNGSLTAPTIEASILVQGGRSGSDFVCHSFVRDGVWEFLGDCTHSLAGQRFEMGPLPVWLAKAARS